MTTVVFVVLVAVCGLFWLAYRRPRPRRWLIPRRAGVPAYPGARVALPAAAGSAGAAPASPRSRDREPSGPATFEATKAHLQHLLASGRTADVEDELRDDADFAGRVRALAEIGTADAARVLEKQLDGTHPRDAAEQARRWAGVAAALRTLNRTDALSAVLRCADAAAGLPGADAVAAEAVGFPNFAATLRKLTSADGRLAVRALARAARGCRDGTLDPAALVRAGIGDHLATVSETAPPAADPWLTAAALEAERIARRVEHWARLLPAGAGVAAESQGARLAASEARRRGWLAGAARRLVARFPAAAADEQAAALRVLDDLRADTSALFPTLPDRRAVWWADAVRGLRWARSPSVGPLLAAQADRMLGSRQPGSAAGVVIGALRGHRGTDTEVVLLRAAVSKHADARRAAVGVFGWWDPFDTAAVVKVLRAARTDPDAGVRAAATAALARFGELAALREFARGLIAEDDVARHATLLTAAEERVSWLWPDLDMLAEAADSGTALAATEALERLREAALGLVNG